MTLLFDLAARAAAVSLVTLSAHGLLCRRSAALRHAVLAAGVAVSIAVLPLALVLPAWAVRIPIDPPFAVPLSSGARVHAPAASEETGPVSSAVPAEAMVDWSWLPALVWAGGSLVCAAGLLGGLARLRRMASRAGPAVHEPWVRLAAEVSAALGLNRPVTLLVAGSPGVLATWGVLRPRVLLPAHASTWSEDRARVVLCHELAHIRRGDWLVQMTAEILRTVLWFNPLQWMLCTRLRRDSEQACDDEVLGAGVPADAYAAHLIDIARTWRDPKSWAAAMPMARSSSLERRIVAMLKTDLDRRPITARTLGLAVLALLAITLPVAMLQASAQTGPATLSGVVYDSSGAVLPEVALTLADAQQRQWNTTTDASGRFEFATVEPGGYVLQVSLPGFRPLQHEFTLGAARDWTQAITLQVGAVQETIAVSTRRQPGAKASSDLGRALRVGGNIRPPQKLVDVRPVYPPAMRDAGLEGTVPMEALIGADGTVTSVRVASAQVHPEFAIAAADAVRQWQFSPTLLNGEAVDVVMTVSVRFYLAD